MRSGGSACPVGRARPPASISFDVSLYPRIFMNRRLIVLAAVCLGMVGFGLLRVLPSPAIHQRVQFAGFTNGVVGVIAPVFASFTTNNAASIQRWLAAGTNVAVFTITNQQSCAIWLNAI